MHIRSVEALPGRYICEVIAYLVTKGVTWREYRISQYTYTHQRWCIEEMYVKFSTYLVTLLGRNMDEVLAYLVNKGATWKKNRPS